MGCGSGLRVSGGVWGCLGVSGGVWGGRWGSVMLHTCPAMGLCAEIGRNRGFFGGFSWFLVAVVDCGWLGVRTCFLGATSVCSAFQIPPNVAWGVLGDHTLP